MSQTTTIPGAGAKAATVGARGRLKAWLAVAAVAIGTFTVVTVENLPMGLLTSIAGGLDVSDGQVGLTVTVSGLVAAATAAVLPVAIRRLDRRVVLVGLIGLMVVANAVPLWPRATGSSSARASSSGSASAGSGRWQPDWPSASCPWTTSRAPRR